MRLGSTGTGTHPDPGPIFLDRKLFLPTARRRFMSYRTQVLALASALLITQALSAQQRRQPPAKSDSAAIKDSTAKSDSAKADSAAQAPVDSAAAPAFAHIFGTVFDSVHMAPLAEARVSLEGTSKFAVTTDRGVFRIDSITPGSYRVRVEHVFLDSIGVTMLTEELPLADGDERTIALGIPSGGTLVAASCPAARRALGPSAVIGRLLDADTEEPVEGARVSVAWEEISINAGLRKLPRLRDARSGADGVFRICGLPPQLEGTLQAQHNGISTSEVRVRIEGEELIVQGLKIGNAETVAVASGDTALRRDREASLGRLYSGPTLQRGNASLTGRVLNGAGNPVVGARVDVIGTPGASLTGANGEFRIDSLPSGTQSVVARQIGFAPVEKPVELSTRGPARVEIIMDRAAQVLAEVRVEADAMDAGLERVGFKQREKAGFGYFLTDEDISRRASSLLTDVFRTIPGLRVVPSGMDYVVQSARSATNGCVTYFVDGARWEAVFPGDVDRLVPAWEIAALEVYNGSSAPAEFQAPGMSSCSSIVIWTKTRINAPTGRRR